MYDKIHYKLKKKLKKKRVNANQKDDPLKEDFHIHMGILKKGLFL